MKELDKVRSFVKVIGKQAKVQRHKEKGKADAEQGPAKGKSPEEKHLTRIEDLSLEETQLSEQLYNSAGLAPVVDAGLKDYDEYLQQENKFINKVIGPRGSDIRGYGEAVAKRVAFAVYALLNKQYGGKVGDLRSHIMSLEDERNRANTRYDELMGRVVGILGDEYKELRTDSKAFMEKLTATLGEDLKESKIDQKALAERLGDIDGLRSQIRNLEKEKKQSEEKHESQITALQNEHKEEVARLESQITQRDTTIQGLGSEKEALSRELTELKGEYTRLASTHEILEKEHSKETEDYKTKMAERDSRIDGLESEKATLTTELEGMNGNYNQLTAAHETLVKEYDQLKTAITNLGEAIPYEEIKTKLAGELHTFLLKDSKVPNAVIDGVGRFIDFEKYLGIAVERGAREAAKQAEETLRATLSE